MKTMLKKLFKILLISILTVTVCTVYVNCEDEYTALYNQIFGTIKPTDENTYNHVMVYVKTEDGADLDAMKLSVSAYPSYDYRYSVGHYRTVQRLPWSSSYKNGAGIQGDDKIRILLGDTPFSYEDFGSTGAFDAPSVNAIPNKGFDINRVTFVKLSYWSDGAKLTADTKAFTDSYWRLEAVADKYIYTVENGDEVLTKMYVKSGSEIEEPQALENSETQHFLGFDIRTSDGADFAFTEGKANMPVKDIIASAVFEDHSFGEWTVTVEPSETTAGSRFRKCTVCDYEVTEDMEKLDHVYSADWSMDHENHWHVCTNKDCDSISDRNAHDMKDGICSVCGYREYEVSVVGEDTWYTNSISNLKFRSTADYEKFQYIEVDGIQIEKENYTSYEGSTYVELFPSFLKTLSVGKHSLGIFSADGSGTADFFIKKHETSSGSSSYVIPKTGIE